MPTSSENTQTRELLKIKIKCNLYLENINHPPLRKKTTLSKELNFKNSNLSMSPL